MFGLLLRAVCGLVFVVAMGLGAQAAQPFSEKAFSEAQAAGKPVLIDVTAPWCPTCRQQKPTLAAIEQERPDLVVFDVDFDSAKDVLRQFRVRSQSTLIVFKGKNEVGRSTGETDPDRLRALVAKGY